MSDLRKNDHPDLFELAAFAEGSLSAAASEAIGSHVADCALCALEIRKLERFEATDKDATLISESHWEEAEVQLASVYEENIRPKVFSTGPRRNGIFSRRWLVPVAAAAVVLAILLPRLPLMVEGPEGDLPPLRGGGETMVVLNPMMPLGEMVGPPEFFAWTTETRFDSYSLNIFTPELELVFEEFGITTEKFAVTDTLLTRIRPGNVYLWTVTGHTGLQSEAVSAPARFEILEIPPQR